MDQVEKKASTKGFNNPTREKILRYIPATKKQV